MIITDADLHLAEQTLRLNSAAGFQSFFSTIWSGYSINVLWNNMSNEIMQIWPENFVAQEDIGTLQFMIGNYFKVYYKNPLTIM